MKKPMIEIDTELVLPVGMETTIPYPTGQKSTLVFSECSLASTLAMTFEFDDGN